MKRQWSKKRSLVCNNRLKSITIDQNRKKKIILSEFFYFQFGFLFLNFCLLFYLKKGIVLNAKNFVSELILISVKRKKWNIFPIYPVPHLIRPIGNTLFRSLSNNINNYYSCQCSLQTWSDSYTGSGR